MEEREWSLKKVKLRTMQWIIENSKWKQQLVKEEHDQEKK
jgi:hypothetical protein